MIKLFMAFAVVLFVSSTYAQAYSPPDTTYTIEGFSYYGDEEPATIMVRVVDDITYAMEVTSLLDFGRIYLGLEVPIVKTVTVRNIGDTTIPSLRAWTVPRVMTDYLTGSFVSWGVTDNYGVLASSFEPGDYVTFIVWMSVPSVFSEGIHTNL